MMKKMKLNLSALQVESFAPLAAFSARAGTVQGQSAPNTPYRECASYEDCVAWPLTWDPYNPCNTDEGSCADAC